MEKMITIRVFKKDRKQLKKIAKELKVVGCAQAVHKILDYWLYDMKF